MSADQLTRLIADTVRDPRTPMRTILRLAAFNGVPLGDEAFYTPGEWRRIVVNRLLPKLVPYEPARMY